jgi:hypothetical protein
MEKAFIFLLALGFAAAASAQQFRWVDKDGRVQYGDTPPPGVKATRLKPPPTGSAPAPAAAAKKDEKPLSPEAAYRKRQQEREEAEKKAAQEAKDAEAKRANCSAAQAQIRQIQSGQRITTTDAKGERGFMDDSQRAAELQRAQQAASEWCN